MGNGKQGIGLPLHRQAGARNRKASGPQRLEGFRKRPDTGDREAGRPEAGNGPQQPGRN